MSPRLSAFPARLHATTSGSTCPAWRSTPASTSASSRSGSETSRVSSFFHPIVHSPARAGRTYPSAWYPGDWPASDHPAEAAPPRLDARLRLLFISPMCAPTKRHRDTARRHRQRPAPRTHRAPDRTNSRAISAASPRNTVRRGGDCFSLKSPSRGSRRSTPITTLSYSLTPAERGVRVFSSSRASAAGDCPRGLRSPGRFAITPPP